jgi:hypothetical protein
VTKRDTELIAGVKGFVAQTHRVNKPWMAAEAKGRNIK